MGLGSWFSKNSTTILTVVGIGASAGACVLSGRAALLINDELIQAHRDAGGGDIPKKQKVKIVAKHIWIPAVVEAGSILCIVEAGHIQNARSAAAIASANLTADMASRALTDYRKQVQKELGDHQDKKIQAAVAQEAVNKTYTDNGNRMPTPVNAPQIGDVICLDDMTRRYFWSTADKIKHARNLLVSQINDEMSATMNDWYEKLGIEPVGSGIGDMNEWTPEDNFDIYIDTTLTPDDRPCLFVTYNPYPHARKRYMDMY